LPLTTRADFVKKIIIQNGVDFSSAILYNNKCKEQKNKIKKRKGDSYK
jgi:hypothetical protein